MSVIFTAAELTLLPDWRPRADHSLSVPELDIYKFSIDFNVFYVYVFMCKKPPLVSKDLLYYVLYTYSHVLFYHKGLLISVYFNQFTI